MIHSYEQYDSIIKLISMLSKLDINTHQVLYEMQDFYGDEYGICSWCGSTGPSCRCGDIFFDDDILRTDDWLDDIAKDEKVTDKL